MALITTHEIDTDGTAPTFAAAAVDDTAETGPRVFLVVKNADGAATKGVTISGQVVLESGDNYPDKVYTTPISGEIWVPLLGVYGNDSKQAEISYPDGVTDVTRAVVKI